MKFPSSSALAVVVALCGLIAAHGQDAKPASRGAAATNAPPAEAEIPASVFLQPSSEKEGRDPFFPNRKAMYHQVQKTGGGPRAVGDLVLKGLSGRPESPLCTINDKVLGPGDEAEVTTSSGKVHVQCLAIRDGIVKILANGSPQELKMKNR